MGNIVKKRIDCLRGSFLLAAWMIIAVFICAKDVNAESPQRSFINRNSTFFRLFFYDRADFRAGYSHGLKRDESDGPGSFKLDKFYVKGEIPVALDDNAFFRIGADYNFRSYTLGGVPSALTNDNSLDVHKASALFGGGVFIGRNFLITAVVKPGLYSDFDGGFNSDDSSIYAEGELVYAINPGTQFVGGLAYDHIFQSETIYPLLGIRVMSEDGRLHISVTAPREARIGYSVDTKAEIFLLGAIDGDEFSINPGTVKTSFKFKEQERRVGTGISYWLTRNLNFELEVGMLLKSDFVFKIENAGQFANDADGAPYATLSFGLAL